MALITQIRKRSGLIIILIALGVFGFLLMDVKGNQNVAGTGSNVGKIAGEAVSYTQFQKTEESLFGGRQGGDTYAKRDYLWNYIVDNILLEKESSKIGLGVSVEELKDLAFGQNLSPVIQQKFVDQSTGRVDRSQLDQIKKSIEGNQLPEDGRRAWSEIEKEIVKDRLQTKYVNLTSKAVYTPLWQAEMLEKEKKELVDLLYVKVPYSSIPDSEVKLTDADFQNYLNANKGKYFQDEETRRISYVTFFVKPTSKDSLEAKTKLLSIKEKYQSAKNDSLFVTANSGQYQDIYLKKNKLEGVMKDTAMDLPVGTIFGPYIENGAYFISKIVDKKMVPDSVKSRHILIQAKTPGDIAKANKTIDSLKIVIESGKNSFDSLAAKFGQDASRAKGGDLGFIPQGGMIKPFNDLIFYKATPHKLYKLTTQYGVHLVEVTAVKYVDTNPGVKIASFREAIVPGDDTQAAIEDVANQFLTHNRTLDAMNKAASGSKDIQVLRSVPVKAHDYNLGALGSSEGSYSIIKWAFTSGAKVGEVSPTLYSFKNTQEFYTDKYVVAALSGIQKEGMPDVASIKEDIKAQVLSQKKGEMLKAKITSKDLNSIASSFQTKVDSAKGVSFAAPFIAGIGNEVKVISTAMKLDVNKVSDPIIGNTALFVIMPINRTSGGPSTNLADIKNFTRKTYESQVGPKVMDSLRKNYKIKDDRYKFFN